LQSFIFIFDNNSFLEYMSFPAVFDSFLFLFFFIFIFIALWRKVNLSRVELYESAIASVATLQILTKILNKRSATEEVPYRSVMLELLSSGRMIDTR